MAITDEQVRAVLPTNPDSLLSGYVDYAQCLVPSPHVFHLGVGLTLLASGCPMSLAIEQVFDHTVKPHMWNLIVGGPACGKTQAVNVGRDLLATVTASLPGGRKSKHNPLGADPRTEEGLRKSLQQRPRQLLLYNDYGSFLGGTSGDHNTNYRAKIRDTLTEIFDGDAYEAVKANDEINIPPTRLSLLGAVTPTQLRLHTTLADWETGFLSRHAILMGAPTMGRDDFTPPPRNDPYTSGLREWLLQELTLRCNPDALFQYEGGVEQRHPVAGQCVGKTRAAHEAWLQLLEDLKVYEPEVDPRLRPSIRRIRLMAAKAALLLSYDYGGAMKSNGEEWELHEDTMVPACDIARLYAQSLVDVSACIAVNQDMIVCNQILEALPADGSWIHRGVILKKVGLLSRSAKFFLETLEERGEIELHNEQSGHQYVRLVEGGAPPEFDYGVVAESLDDVG